MSLTLIPLLAFLSLFLLLFSIGLALSWPAIRNALATAPLGRALILNFVLMPGLAAILVKWLNPDLASSRALILLAGAPFAPVTPLFVQMSGRPIALAAALTALMPLFSSVLTPLSIAVGLWWSQDTLATPFSSGEILRSLFTSITLPLALGVGLHHAKPEIARKLQKPVEWIAETIGAGSLLTLFWWLHKDLAELSSTACLAAAMLAEGGFLSALLISPRILTIRLTLAFGTACRNIGLSLFIAAGLVQDSSILMPLFAESITLLALALIHVGLARACLKFVDSEPPA